MLHGNKIRKVFLKKKNFKMINFNFFLKSADIQKKKKRKTILKEKKIRFGGP